MIRPQIESMALLSLFALVHLACEPRAIPPATDGSPPVAKAGDLIITTDRLEGIIDRIETKTPQVLSTHLQKKRLLEQVINMELLYEEALKQGFDESHEFRARLAEAYVLDIAEKSASEINDEDLEYEYRRNQKAYDQVSARHILFKTEGLSAEEDRKRYQQMLQIRKDLLTNPDKFETYAREYSEDSTARNGGDLGLFTFDRMVAPFAEAAFRLEEPGQISEIVKTQYGYHLIQLVDRKVGLDLYRERIRQNLIRQAQSRALNSEIDRLRSKNDVNIFEDNLLKMTQLPEEVLEDPDKVLPFKELDKKPN